MSRKVCVWMGVVVCVSLLVSGCGKKLTFDQGRLNAYRVTAEKPPKTDLSMEQVAFTQEIKEVNPDGSAVAEITLKNIQYAAVDSRGKPIEYDSNQQKDAIRDLMGQSYMIQINPFGKVTILEETLPEQIADARAETMFAPQILDTNTLERLHEKVFTTEDQWQQIPYASLKLSFAPNQTDRYKSVSDVVKDFRFEQPNLGKLREEQTRTTVEMTFTRNIQSASDNGSAVAQITIDGLKVTIINKNENRLSFDSSKEADMNNPLAKLLGQSYTIRLTPDGGAELIDAAEAIAAVPAGYENRVADSILSKENVQERHRVQAIPDKDGPYIVSDQWSVTVPSPPGLLAPKSYEKVYTLTELDTTGGQTVATVKMDAGEAAEPAEGASAGGMGMFARMFDNEDTYTGLMSLNVDTGTVLSAEETLISTYLAQEMPENGDPDKGPDTLTMQFTHRSVLEKLD